MRRAGFLSLHRWLGLIMAPFLLVQVLTGALLVVHEATLPAPPAAPSAEMASPGRLIAAAEAAAPGYRVARLYLPGSTGAAAFAEMTAPGGARTYAELDGTTARPVQTGALWHFPYRAAVQLHYHLAAGTIGLGAVTALGAALALAVLSGLLFWWPGRGRVIQALRVRRQLPAHARLRQWHRTVGALAAALSLFSAVTGLLLAVPDLTAALAPAAAAAPPPPARPLAPAAIDRAVAAAQAQFPGAPLRDLRLPPAERIDLNFDAPARNARAVHVASVRPSDGAVLKALPAQDNPVLWMKVLALHTGQSFGPLGLVLLLAEAGALIFLAYAGLRMWLRNRRKGRT